MTEKRRNFDGVRGRGRKKGNWGKGECEFMYIDKKVSTLNAIEYR